MPEIWNDWLKLVKDITSCKKCEMSQTKQNYVIGNIKLSLKPSVLPWIMFIGDTPGAHEDVQGLPFQGQAGDALENQIKRIRLHKFEYYICNAIKCRPIDEGGNQRAPTDDEYFNCSFYLARQYNLLKPKVVVLLGKSARNAWKLVSNKDPKLITLDFIHPAYGVYHDKMPEFQKQFDELRNIVLHIRNSR